MRPRLKFCVDGSVVEIYIQPLDCLSLYLRSIGFVDIDVEPICDGYKISATKEGSSVSVKGATLDEACEKFLTKVI